VLTVKPSSGTGCSSNISYRCHISPGSGTLLHHVSQSVASKPRDIPDVAAAHVVRCWHCVWMRCFGSLDAVADTDHCEHDVTSASRATDSCACCEFAEFCFQFICVFCVNFTDRILIGRWQ